MRKLETSRSRERERERERERPESTWKRLEDWRERTRRDAGELLRHRREECLLGATTVDQRAASHTRSE